MNIVTELQKDILDEKKSLSSLLRKAYLIAKKLKLNEWSSWIEKEMNGYDLDDPIPNYRKIKGIAKGLNPFRGWIPIDFGNEEFENIFSFQNIKQSISDLETLVLNSESGLSSTLPPSASKQLGIDTEVRIFIGVGSVTNIINCTRNKLLDWTLELEHEGIKGENMQFLEEEVEKAQNTSTTTINNIYGGTNNFQMAQGNDAIYQTQNNRPESMFFKLWSWVRKIFIHRQ